MQQRANVAANAPILTVIDLSALEIEVQMPEVFAHDLTIGMPAEVRDETARMPATSARCRRRSSTARSPAACRFGDKKPAGLRQNQQLTTRILIDERPNVLMVDRGRSSTPAPGAFAYVVHGDVAERTAIQVGATSLNAVEIVSGLKEGDRIVISGTDELQRRQRVALN